MQATPISNINSNIKMMVVREPSIIFLFNTQVVVDNRKMSRCPAVKLAAKRRPRAIGWARSLTVSIQTIKGIKNFGVP